MTKWCLWCAQELRFVPGKGWLHPDGQLYQTFVGEDGKVRDDHCAHPTNDQAAAQKMAAEMREKKRR